MTGDISKCFSSSSNHPKQAHLPPCSMLISPLGLLILESLSSCLLKPCLGAQEPHCGVAAITQQLSSGGPLPSPAQAPELLSLRGLTQSDDRDFYTSSRDTSSFMLGCHALATAVPGEAETSSFRFHRGSSTQEIKSSALEPSASKVAWGN